MLIGRGFSMTMEGLPGKRAGRLKRAGQEIPMMPDVVGCVQEGRPGFPSSLWSTEVLGNQILDGRTRSRSNKSRSAEREPTDKVTASPKTIWTGKSIRTGPRPRRNGHSSEGCTRIRAGRRARWCRRKKNHPLRECQWWCHWARIPTWAWQTDQKGCWAIGNRDVRWVPARQISRRTKDSVWTASIWCDSLHCRNPQPVKKKKWKGEIIKRKDSFVVNPHWDSHSINNFDGSRAGGNNGHNSNNNNQPTNNFLFFLTL